ncbi:MAG: hypothetical protein V4685_10785 [Bacteroidota bacterium]
MKIILSRKGFDSGYGGQPSPILPDGTLLSMPIPYSNEIIKYTDLYHHGESYYKILKDLKPNSKIQHNHNCHLDPDLRFLATKRQQKWKPIFGQAEAAQTHLQNQKVSIGDIFLFFGWFRQTQIVNGKYSYKYGSPDLHLIYGYMQIGEIYVYGCPFPDYASHHPHTGGVLKDLQSNCIYVATDRLSFDETLPGADSLTFKNNLILTKRGMSRSKWDLPDFFKNVDMSYHTKDSFKQDYFQSAAKGQEFVISADNNVIEWTKELLTKNRNE